MVDGEGAFTSSKKAYMTDYMKIIGKYRLRGWIKTLLPSLNSKLNSTLNRCKVIYCKIYFIIYYRTCMIEMGQGLVFLDW